MSDDAERDDDSGPSDGVAFYVTNGRSVQIGVTEATRGEMDGRAMVILVSPVTKMPLLLDPDTACNVAARLEAAARMATEQRSAVWG